MIDVERLRAAFPAARAAAYLNTGTFGPLPERTREAMVEHLDEVGWAAEELRDIRDGYAGTLDAAATSAYFGAYGKAVRRRYPELYDAYRHDEDLAGGVDEDD